MATLVQNEFEYELKVMDHSTGDAVDTSINSLGEIVDKNQGTFTVVSSMPPKPVMKNEQKPAEKKREAPKPGAIMTDLEKKISNMLKERRHLNLKYTYTPKARAMKKKNLQKKKAAAAAALKPTKPGKSVEFYFICLCIQLLQFELFNCGMLFLQIW
jgi:hypothetical protein